MLKWPCVQSVGFATDGLVEDKICWHPLLVVDLRFFLTVRGQQLRWIWGVKDNYNSTV